MVIRIFCLSVFLFAPTLFAQQQLPQNFFLWQELGNEQTISVAGVGLDEEGNILTAGTWGYWPTYLFIKKIAPDGSIIFDNMFQSYGDLTVRDMIVDDEANLYITGKSFHDVDLWTAKYNSSGQLEWEVYDSTANDGLHIKRHSSGYLAVTGWGSYDINTASYSAVTILYNDSGDVVWKKELRGLPDTQMWGTDVHWYPDGSLLSSVVQYSPEPRQLILQKYNIAGDLLWERVTGTTTTICKIIGDNDGNTYVLADSIFKFTSDGHLRWKHRSGEISYRIELDSTMEAGQHLYTLSENYLTKRDTSGDISWQKFLGKINDITLDPAGYIHISRYDVLEFTGDTYDIHGNHVASMTADVSGYPALVSYMGKPRGHYLAMADNRKLIMVAHMERGSDSHASYWGIGQVSFDLNPLTSIEEPLSNPEIPEQFQLLQNYPNPFNPATIIEYELPEAGEVRLEIFNLLGQRLATVVDELQMAGSYSVQFNTASELLNHATSGILIARLSHNRRSQSIKMLYIK